MRQDIKSLTNTHFKCHDFPFNYCWRLVDNALSCDTKLVAMEISKNRETGHTWTKHSHIKTVFFWQMNHPRSHSTHQHMHINQIMFESSSNQNIFLFYIFPGLGSALPSQAQPLNPIRVWLLIPWLIDLTALAIIICNLNPTTQWIHQLTFNTFLHFCQ